MTLLVIAKIHLRATWLLKLDWDDPLPAELKRKWIQFFKDIYKLEEIRYPRCLKPQNAVGLPWLILLSDGSEQAYGCAAYARWICKDGSVVMRLIMAKCRIAPHEQSEYSKNGAEWCCRVKKVPTSYTKRDEISV